MDANRLRTGEMIAGVSGVALFIIMFLPWFGFDLGSAARSARIGIAVSEVDTHFNAWESFDFIDLVLFVTAVVAVGLAVAAATARPSPCRSPPARSPPGSAILVDAAGPLPDPRSDRLERRRPRDRRLPRPDRRRRRSPTAAGARCRRRARRSATRRTGRRQRRRRRCPACAPASALRRRRRPLRHRRRRPAPERPADRPSERGRAPALGSRGEPTAAASGRPPSSRSAQASCARRAAGRPARPSR